MCNEINKKIWCWEIYNYRQLQLQLLKNGNAILKIIYRMK